LAALAVVSVAASVWSMRAPGSGAPVEPSAAATLAEPRGAASERAAAPAPSTAPATAGDDAPPLAPAARPADRQRWKERDFYDELLVEPDLRRRAVEVLAGDGPQAEKLALLRVAFERDPGLAPELFERAVTSLPDAGDAHGESVPRAAVEWLAERAPREPRARAILERLAWDAEGEAPAAALRARCVLALLSSAPESELPRLRGRLAGERDDELHASAARVLDARRERRAIAAARGSETEPD
jgi:hypothetical protein